MIATLPVERKLAPHCHAFLDALARSGFEGDIARDDAMLTVLSTDNSVYQRFPQAAVFPRHAEDVQRLARLADQAEFQQVVLTPRGGGTGTNGQSLTDGIVVDISRHMNRILDIDVANRRVRVQAGVVKDQLNAALKPLGFFFAPELSTSNRATLGGMINTDASGQGSCRYGKTRNHVLELDYVLLGGQRIASHVVDDDELARRCGLPGRAGLVHRVAKDIFDRHRERIVAGFPPLNRCLTGYDLAHLRETDGRFNLNSVLCGAEGSLGFVVEATLNILPIPKHSVLVNVQYAGFMDALRDARALMATEPLSIETVDSKVLGLAMKDIVWHGVAEFFPEQESGPALGINLVEFSDDDPVALQAMVDRFLEVLRTDDSVQRLGYTLAEGRENVTKVYGMRKRAVGLLGNAQGEARPQPFVEDAAVPPENLPEFIAEFRALLDSHGLQYGMFGHVDAGVLHVRPALDMKDPAQAALLRPISDAVAALAQRYGGLLWGEHGKGVRSEYAPKFFGELYPLLQSLKTAFDPRNQLNPGKIATPTAATKPLLRIDGVPLRGERDREIDERVWSSYGAAMHCNGNGACYNYDPDDAMCPSWKATRDRVQSPKGRASLMREWLWRQQKEGVDVLQSAEVARRQPLWRSLPAKAGNAWRRWRGEQDFSHEVYDAMAGCLACKSCSGQCPIKVDVPAFRARFLELYHSRYFRPMKDYLVGSLESTVPTLARYPKAYNAVMGAGLTRKLLARTAGLSDSPLLDTRDFGALKRQWRVAMATPQALAALSPAERARSVVLVQDAFTRYFDTGVLADWLALVSLLGFRIFLAPFMPNGKPMQVQGFLKGFEKAARRNAARLKALADTGVPLVGLDPAMTLTYRQEYLRLLGDAAPDVRLPQEWLLDVVPEPQAGAMVDAQPYLLMAHCTEKTNAPASVAVWQKVFERFGLILKVQASGCCGMSGTYGHETRNQETSRVIFSQSWEPVLISNGATSRVLADGYSCRSQVKRFSPYETRHPLQALRDHVQQRMHISSGAAIIEAQLNTTELSVSISS